MLYDRSQIKTFEGPRDMTLLLSIIKRIGSTSVPGLFERIIRHKNPDLDVHYIFMDNDFILEEVEKLRVFVNKVLINIPGFKDDYGWLSYSYNPKDGIEETEETCSTLSVKDLEQISVDVLETLDTYHDGFYEEDSDCFYDRFSEVIQNISKLFKEKINNIKEGGLQQ